MRSDSRTNWKPRRIAPMKRSPGSTEGLVSRFHRYSTTPAKIEITKFRANGDRTKEREPVITPVKKPETPPVVDPANPGGPVIPPVGPPPSPKPETDKVLVATGYIAPGTEITNDLLAEKFAEIELPRGLADGAVNPKNYPGKFVKTGLTKGQWLTIEGIADASGKPVPRDQADQPKPDTTPQAGPPVVPVAPARKKYHDVSVHTASGTRVFRYEEVRPGEYRFLGEVSPGARTPDEQPKTNPKVD